jgi:hypothetical protein
VTSKVRLKLGQLEVECEGTEEFLRDELPKLLETFSKLQPTVAAVGHPPADTNGVGASLPPGEKAMTTSSTAFVAQKLASQTGPELATAALLYLAHSGQEAVKRKHILAEMRTVKSVFRAHMDGNFAKFMDRLAKDKIVNVVKAGEWALTTAARADLEQKLAEA